MIEIRESDGFPVEFFPVLVFAPGLAWNLILVLTFDFRSDLDKMIWLKSLPAPSWAISVGQLLTPVLISSVFVISLFAAFFWANRAWQLLMYAAVIAPPAIAVLFAVENLLFLLFPTRFTPGDIGIIARMFLVFLLKALIVTPCIGIALAIAGITFWASSSIFLGVSMASFTFLAETAVLVVCIAWAFRRFDVDTSPPH